MRLQDNSTQRGARRSLALGILLTLFTVPALKAQAPSKDNVDAQVTAPAIKVESRIVLVDVVVTNHRGETIPKLGQDAFQIREDGKPQIITAFEEHKREISAPANPPVPPPDVHTNISAAPPGDAVNVLLIDMLNTYPWFQKDVCNQAIKFLASVPPGTRLAIFTLNEQQLRLVRGFTADFSGLSGALNGQQSGVIPEASWLNPTPSQHGAEMEGLSAMIKMQAAPVAVDSMREYLGQENAAKIGARSELTLQAFQHLARYLSGIPARKNIIWFADSFPVSFATDDKVHAPNHQLHLQQTSDMLTAAQVAIYPASARGLLGTTSAWSPNPFKGSDISADNAQQLFEEFATSQTNMESLARETGGRAFYNSNALDTAMAKAVEEGSRYYTIAYSPTNTKNDGRYRRIEVKIADADYKLSYRRGYYADNPAVTPTAANGDPLIPLVGFGMPNFDQIAYKIRALPLDPQPAPDAPRAGLNTDLKGPLIRYGVDAAVSLRNFKLETTPDGVRHGRIEAMLVAYGRDGRILNIVKLNSRMALTSKDYSQLLASGLPFHLEIDIPPGDIYLRTGVYDLASGSAGTLGFPLTVIRPATAATK